MPFYPPTPTSPESGAIAEAPPNLSPPPEPAFGQVPKAVLSEQPLPPLAPFDPVELDIGRKLVRDPIFRNYRPEMQIVQIGDFLTQHDLTYAQKPFEAQQLLAKNFQQMLEQETAGETIARVTKEWGPTALSFAASMFMGPEVAALTKAGRLWKAIQLEAEASGLGSAAGSAMGDVAQVALTDQPHPSAGETLVEAAKEGVLGFGIGGAAKGLETAYGWIRRKALAPGATDPEVVAAWQLLGEEAPLTWSQLSGEKTPGVVEFIENFFRYGVGSRKYMRDIEAKTVNAAIRATDELIEQLDPARLTESDVGKRLLNAYEKGLQAEQTEATLRHQVVERLGQSNIQIPTQNVMKVAVDDLYTKKVLDLFSVPSEHRTAIRGALPGYYKRKGFEEMMDNAGLRTMTFEDADRAKSIFQRIARRFAGGDPEQRLISERAGEFADAIRDEMTGTLQQHAQKNPRFKPLQREYDAYGKFYKEEVVERFQNDILMKLTDALKDTPAKLYNLFHDKTDLLQKVQRATPQYWEPLQARLLTTILEDAADIKMIQRGLSLRQAVQQGAVKEINVKKIHSALNGMSQEFKQELLKGPQGDAFNHLINALDVAARKPGGTGKVMVQLIQGSAAGTVLLSPFFDSSGKSTAGAILVVLSPAVLARFLMNPVALHNLANGIAGTPLTSNARRLITATAMGVVDDNLFKDVNPLARFREAARNIPPMVPLPSIAEGLRQPGPRFEQAPPTPTRETPGPYAPTVTPTPPTGETVSPY